MTKDEALSAAKELVDEIEDILGVCLTERAKTSIMGRAAFWTRWHHSHGFAQGLDLRAQAAESRKASQ